MTDNFDGDLKDGSADDVSRNIMCRWDEALVGGGAGVGVRREFLEKKA